MINIKLFIYFTERKKKNSYILFVQLILNCILILFKNTKDKQMAFVHFIRQNFHIRNFGVAVIIYFKC